MLCCNVWTFHKIIVNPKRVLSCRMTWSEGKTIILLLCGGNIQERPCLETENLNNCLLQSLRAQRLCPMKQGSDDTEGDKHDF